MKRVRCLILAGMCLVAGFLMAQPTEPVLVQGDPPITLEVAKAHIRLMEFVLATRLTTKQKDVFIDLVKKECAEMDRSERGEFIQAMDLLNSMLPMSGPQLDSVREILRADFEQSADEVGDDPAAKLFFEVTGATQKKIAESPNFALSTQAFAAFVEYLEFCKGLPQSPAPLSDADKAKLQKSLESGFNALSDPLKATLSGFDRTWHVIKAAWKEAGSEARGKWQKSLQQPLSASGSTPLFESAWLGAGIQPGLWQEMASAAFLLGESETAWIATKPVDVW